MPNKASDIKVKFIKYRPLILYVVFGGGTTLINYGMYALFTRGMSIDYASANVMAWFGGVTFAYATNRVWVFGSKARTWQHITREAVLFYAARLASLVIDTALLWMLHDLCGVNDLYVKIFNNVIVVLMNYFFSRFVIFKV